MKLRRSPAGFCFAFSAGPFLPRPFWLRTFFLGAAVACSAGAQVEVPVEKSLAQWTLRGQSEVQRQADGAVVLPAGSDLVRRYDGAIVEARLAKSPVFAIDPEEVAVLGLADASLVFRRESDGGAIFLQVGEGDLAPVVRGLALREDGTVDAEAPIVLSRQGQLIVAAVGRETLRGATNSSASDTEVSLSSGRSHAWSLAGVRIVAPRGDSAKDLEEITSEFEGHDPAAQPTAADSARGTRDRPSERILQAATGATVINSLPQASTTPVGTGLEVFTPPSVRHPRAAEVRQLLSGEAANK